MDPQQSSNTPMGQTINPGVGGPDYVPQPIPDAPKPGGRPRKLVFALLAALAAVLLLLFAGWWWAAQARANYIESAHTFKQRVTDERDAINDAFVQQDATLSDAEAPIILNDGAENFNKILATAPAKPKIFWFIPVSIGDMGLETDALIKAAQNYQSAMRRVADTYNYYVDVTSAFQPLKDLGTITVDNQDELTTEWSSYLAAIKEITPPAGLESVHSALVTSTEEIGTKLNSMLEAYKEGDTDAYKSLVIEADTAVKQTSKDFAVAIDEQAGKANDSVNERYDQLDELL